MIADTFFIEETEQQVQESDGALLTRLGMDGELWAQEFMKHIQGKHPSHLDESLMIGWFCNAIMAGWDTQAQKHHKKIDSLRAMINIQTSPGNADVNEYMRGMANGLICAGSCFDIADVDTDLIEAPEHHQFVFATQTDLDNAWNDGIASGRSQVIRALQFHTVEQIHELYGWTNDTDVMIAHKLNQEAMDEITGENLVSTTVRSFQLGDVVTYNGSQTKYTVEGIDATGNIFLVWFVGSELHRSETARRADLFNLVQPDGYIPQDYNV